MRRRPIEPPHLSTTERHIPTPATTRRRGIVPSQTTLSVQNIPDYSTPAGSAMANEEFRRLRLAVNAVEAQIQAPAATPIAPAVAPTKESPSTEESTVINETTIINNYLDIPETMESGFVYLNRLPLNPMSRPNGELATNDYKYDNYTYTPDNGYYGWYVYGIIRYKFKLPEPRAYLLNLIDIHEIQIENNFEELKLQAIRDYINNNVPSWVDKTDPEVVAKYIYQWYQTYWIPQRGFEKQEGYPEDEPIIYQDEFTGATENAIIVHGVYKPDLDTYRGYMRPQELYMVDIERRIARTNLIYYYTLHRKV